MKRILILSSVFLMINIGALNGQAALLVLIFGEKAATENFHFSLKAGFNYSIISEVENGNSRLGANFGLVNNIKLSEKFYLIPEFLALSQKGIRNVPVLSTGNSEMDSLLVDPSSTDRKLNYIDIPVLLKYKITKRLSISAGPQISFLTSAADIYSSSPIGDVILTTQVDIKDAIKAVDFGISADISYRVSEQLAGKGMDVFFRYNLGFIDIQKNNTGPKHTNTTFQLGIALPFIENKSE